MGKDPSEVFDIIIRCLYDLNMKEQEDWEAGKYYLASMNFGGLMNVQPFAVIKKLPSTLL